MVDIEDLVIRVEVLEQEVKSLLNLLAARDRVAQSETST